MTSTPLSVRAPRVLPLAFVLACLGAIFVAAAASFRLDLASALAVALPARWPRLLLAAAVGAALALASALRRQQGENPLCVDVDLFGASAGAALAGALASIHVGPWALLPAAVPGALLGVGVLRAIWKLPRRALLLLVVPYALAMYALYYASGYGKGLVDGQRAMLWWLTGDVGHARELGAALVALLALALIAKAAWLDRSAKQSGVTALLATGMAVGAAGPIAFVGAFAAQLAGAACRRSSAAVLLGASALAGAAVLLLVHAAQPLLIGGYFLALNVATGFLALPLLFVARARSLGPAPAWWRGLEAGTLIALYVFAGYVIYRVSSAVYVVT
jgi:ABC-type Fe3+-siderophore transport system permease subunit